MRTTIEDQNKAIIQGKNVDCCNNNRSDSLFRINYVALGRLMLFKYRFGIPSKPKIAPHVRTVHP